jgi:hypothetical protein
MSKWIHEIILEKIPPFSWLPSGYSIMAQMIIMEIAGVTLGVFLSLPLLSMLLGTLAILVISLWSFLLTYSGSTIRRLEPPSDILEKKVISDYRKTLFSRQHYELYLGSLILVSLIFYLSFLNQNLVRYWLGEKLSLVPLLLVLLILWDVSYRLGVGLWSAVISFRRSNGLRRVSRIRDKMRYVNYHGLSTLKRVDFINLVCGLATLFLYPLFSTDLALFGALLIYSSAIFLFSAASITMVCQVARASIRKLFKHRNESNEGYKCLQTPVKALQ